MFFVSLILFAFFVVLNLYVAVILENFKLAGEEEAAKITEAHLQEYAGIHTLYTHLFV
jgi:hypothetical protein